MRSDRFRAKCVALGLFSVAALLVILKFTPWELSESVRQSVSLNVLTARSKTEAMQILMVPTGALLVVIVRLTLGFRVLGPFRSILLAAAFQSCGALLGLLFLGVTTVIVVFAREPIRSLRLPYFGRITLLLSLTAAIMVLGTMFGGWVEIPALERIAYFPIVVLCLIGDAFHRTLRVEGFPSALFRMGITAALALFISAIAYLDFTKWLLTQFPEVLLLEVAGIIIVSKFMAYRCLAFLSPTPVNVDDSGE